jgi:tetratricopeptide (TPR) repeat protein
MMRWNFPIARAAVFSAIVACPAMAQKPAKGGAAPASKCTVATDKPDEVKTATSSLAIAQIGGRPEDQQKKLKTAVSALTGNPSKYSSNKAGHDFVLGQALVLWAQQPGEPTTVKKGDIGFLGDKDQTIDLLVTADSLFSVVEQGNPDCEQETAYYRQMPWRPLASRAATLINTDSLAQADSVLKRAAVINGKSPFTYYFRGMLAEKRNDLAAASDSYVKGMAALPADVASDSSLLAVKDALEFRAAYTTYMSAKGKAADEKKAGMLKAADLYKRYLADFPTGTNVAAAQAGVAAALAASGDTKSVATLWDDMLANPGKYTDAQLYDAGTQAFTSNQQDRASKLMDVAQTVNPWLRQGLYNAANIYWKNGQFDKMRAAAHRLTEIDPNNPDNFQLLALSYQGLAKATKDPKVVKAYNDSLNTAFAANEKVPVRVSFEQFGGAGSAKRTVTGTLENLTAAPKAATLKLDFIDLKGVVVSSQSTTVQLGPKEKKAFTLTGDGATIVGYKYTPIS